MRKLFEFVAAMCVIGAFLSFASCWFGTMTAFYLFGPEQAADTIITSAICVLAFVSVGYAAAELA